MAISGVPSDAHRTACVGDARVLRFLLNANWATWRFSYELSAELYGPTFQNLTFGVSDDLLARWIPAGGTVLDVGCGYGRLCHMASRYASRVVGIDYDPVVIAHAQETNRDSRVEFRVGDARTALPNDQFDVVLVVAVLEHIEDVDRLLGDLRHLASRIIVEVPDFDADVPISSAGISSAPGTPTRIMCASTLRRYCSRISNGMDGFLANGGEGGASCWSSPTGQTAHPLAALGSQPRRIGRVRLR